MDKVEPQKRLPRIVSALLLVLGSICCSTLFGVLYARFLMPKRGMGWDQIADGLGAMMVGAFLGLALGIYLCSFLKTVKKRLIAFAAFTLLTATSVLVVRTTNKASQKSGASIIEMKVRAS